MLHLANGDHAADVLRRAGLPGEVAAWADCLDQGPLSGRAGTAQFRTLRAAFLESCGLGDTRAQLDVWDAPLLLRPDEVVLWFESDLNCQLALVHHLSVRPASLVLTPAPVANYAPEELASMFPHRTQPNRAILGVAQAAWNAVTSPDPREIEKVLHTDLGALPFLGPALRRLLEELPAPGSGLSRTDRQILESGGDFRTSQAREEVPFITDVFFALRVEELHGALSESERAACLAGRLDYRARASDRWVGGVRLAGVPCWRWDGTRAVLG